MELTKKRTSTLTRLELCTISQNDWSADQVWKMELLARKCEELSKQDEDFAIEGR
jgi:hypothetical protein